MNKILLGILLGAVLGAIDGATAWFTPEVRNAILGIIIGSTVKGIIAGIAAGWFARKVQNVAAGIVFGLVVGAILAYGIVYMNQGKYFVAIMLPGSLVGAICGWATQRYGNVQRRGAAQTVGVLSVALLFALNAHAAEDAKKVTAAQAFAKLKALEGKWTAPPLAAGMAPIGVTYHVASGGTTVQETLFVGSPHEMNTMYVVDGDDLVAMHYCSAGNQPLMKLNLAKSTPDKLVFDFVSLRGKGMYVHDGWIGFGNDGMVEAAWYVTDESGKPLPKPHHFDLTRAQ